MRFQRPGHGKRLAGAGPRLKNSAACYLGY
jgi:hypothetical protein